MEKNRDNCLILFINPIEEDKINVDLKTAFGSEQGKKINRDLLVNAYRKVKNFQNAISIISYEKTSNHPDLTWIDHDDPGFVEFREKNLEDRIRDTFKLSFFTGAKKAILIDPMTPEIKEEWLAQAFEAINDKTVALGVNDDASFYLLGFTQSNIKILDTPGFTFGKSAENLTERIKRGKLSVFFTPEAYGVKNEEYLRRWSSKAGKELPKTEKPSETPVTDSKIQDKDISARKQHKRVTRLN